LARSFLNTLHKTASHSFPSLVHVRKYTDETVYKALVMKFEVPLRKLVEGGVIDPLALDLSTPIEQSSGGVP
jgi:hypothetical protein